VSTPAPEALARLDAAYACFREVTALGLEARLTTEVEAGIHTGWRPNFRDGEFDVVVETPPMAGVLHEDIAALLSIAERHGARVWLGKPDGKLSILFPIQRVPGPGEEEPEARPKTKRQRKAVAS
jgi:hypothetical protein